MALVRWNPWGELYALSDQMDRLFGPVDGTRRTREAGVAHGHLPLDIRQTDGAFFIDASVPGLRPDDIEVTFDDGVLTIRGTSKDSHDDEKGEYVRRERRVASVVRRVTLPVEVRADEIEASFNDGVLTVTVPRAQRAQPRRIAVSAGAVDVHAAAASGNGSVASEGAPAVEGHAGP